MLTRPVRFAGLTFLLAACLSAPSARAETVWAESGAVLDTVVADTGTAAPPTAAGGNLAPLGAPVPFGNFRYPHVDEAENVTFIADDPVYPGGGPNHGIFRSPAPGETAGGDGLQALVRAGETRVPGTDVPLRWFRGLQMDGTDFVFNATDDAEGRGLYHWSGGVLRTIARSGVTVLPGESAALANVEYGALSAGRVLFSADHGANGATALVLHDLATGTNRVLARTGTPVPGHPGETFRYVSPQNWLEGNHLVFRGARVADPHARQSPPRQGPDAAAAPTEGQRGLYAWTGLDWDRSDASLDAARLRVVADWTTAVPALAGRRFDDLRSAPVTPAGLVAFGAGGAGWSGVYLADLAASGVAGAVRPVVDTESEVAGLFRGRFTRFDTFVTVFGRNVVFVGHAAGGYTGVFLFQVDRDELFLLADNRAPIEGKRVTAFEIAGRFLVRDRFAVTARFADKTSGVYLATIPARSFKRLQPAPAASGR